MANALPPVPGAILGATPDPDTRLAMLVGSRLEGGWGPTYGVGDQGTSFGPFQIHKVGSLHADITADAAQDPVQATNYMLPTYRAAVGRVDPSLWVTDPEKAAERAAFLAESPAVDYYASQGAGNVDAAYLAAQQVLGGTWQPSATPGGTGGGGGGTAGQLTSSIPGAGIISGLTSGWANDLFKVLARVGIIVAAGAGVIVGLAKAADPNGNLRSAVTQSAKRAGETAAVAAA